MSTLHVMQCILVAYFAMQLGTIAWLIGGWR